MRIISKMKDYYDGVQGMDGDHADVWIRKQQSHNPWELLDLEIVADPFSTTKKTDSITELFSFGEHHFHNINFKNYTLKKYLIGFCGKIYPVILAEGNTQAGGYPHYRIKKLAPDVIIRDYKSMLAFIDTHNITEKYYKWRFIKKNNDSYNAAMHNYFNTEHTFLHAAFFKLNTPVFVLEYNQEYTTDHNNPKYIITENCVLKELKFQQVFDAYSAYQEICMFRSGVLCNTEVITDISDEDRKKQHGYHSYSFKTRPRT